MTIDPMRPWWARGTRALVPRLMSAGLILAAARTAPAAPRADQGPPGIAPGPFRPGAESLKQYRCPDWFRDLKLGIWAHWGPQAVPMFGDWYAKHLYVQGHPQYKDHLEHF